MFLGNIQVFISACSPLKVIRNQAKLFEGGFEVVDDFLDDDVEY
jgi:hypothetical protein